MMIIKTFSITTDRLILRPQTINDFDVWYPLYADPHIFHLANAPGFTPEEGWNRLLRNIGHWATFGYGIFSVFQKYDGRFLGETGLAHFHRSRGPDFDPFAEASWVISPSAQGKGIAQEAAIAAHQWFVDAFSPARTVCLIAKNNPASVRVAEVVGYRIYEECIYKGADCLKLVCQWENPQPAILSE
ncbi:GNAT family N-acetyltransferase [Citrobacter freundii]|uniref:GNAT family N-acetyltransferase n=1 Tax=Citrobacter sp. wls711 TaxID=2576425 RepID=UPI000BBD15B8|nr:MULTISPECIES: GNAT family N-acetyltransferase [Citrobacter]HEE0119655.1 GNAT family N-acetyltransferase [Citrobacter gillenii]ATF49404.1 GNAT family N-acetyltransferase [Citrobacter werkmanii]EJB8470531.1 GNAT family N-acetyltransferase [Citrobacter freundii]EJB8560912.1 GNAT family N-acetyltransferase [Citrobacter freundii]MBA8033962.1 GNAT family N-acetyltransferase [Citrobacter freundii]